MKRSRFVMSQIKIAWVASFLIILSHSCKSIKQSKDIDSELLTDTLYYHNNAVRSVQFYKISIHDTLKTKTWEHYDRLGNLILLQDYREDILYDVKIVGPGTMEIENHRYTFITDSTDLRASASIRDTSNLLINGWFDNGYNSWISYRSPDFYTNSGRTYNRPDQSILDSGFIGMGVFGRTWMEYAATRLKSPLKKDSFYIIQYDYVPNRNSRYLTSSFGLMFNDALSISESSLDYTNVLLRKDTFDVNPNVWRTIKDTIKAKGNENYLIIGFHGLNYDSGNILIHPDMNLQLYYLVDNVQVYKWSGIGRDKSLFAVLYRVNGFNLTETYKRQLKSWLNEKSGNASFEVHGYASIMGSEDSNMELSRKRAEEVVRYMTEILGVSPSNISTIPHGEIGGNRSKQMTQVIWK